jgi:hypothetical protein
VLATARPGPERLTEEAQSKRRPHLRGPVHTAAPNLSLVWPQGAQRSLERGHRPLQSTPPTLSLLPSSVLHPSSPTAKSPHHSLPGRPTASPRPRQEMCPELCQAPCSPDSFRGQERSWRQSTGNTGDQEVKDSA